MFATFFGVLGLLGVLYLSLWGMRLVMQSVWTSKEQWKIAGAAVFYLSLFFITIYSVLLLLPG